MIPMSDKLKEYLKVKLKDLNDKYKKLKRKRKFIRYLILGLSIGSIFLTVALQPLSAFISPLLFTLITILIAFATLVGYKHNPDQYKNSLSKIINNKKLLIEKLDYIVSCNGDLTKQDINNIIRDVNF
jgi:uncharacterized membrane protein YbjE (DUF340 family)